MKALALMNTIGESFGGSFSELLVQWREMAVVKSSLVVVFEGRMGSRKEVVPERQHV
jgi:hypothetical protein